ncbi:MAG: cupin domain-containing protein [Candidatus Bathyarchaeia archaeon]
MTSPGVQVVKPETDLSTIGVEDAIIDRISNGAADTLGLNISIVRFPRGVRRPWSEHVQDQYAWIVSGKGIIAFGDEETELHPGEIVFIPANTMHQHGASEEAGMTQLSIIGGTEPRGTSVAL